jgi:hypothetical protein
MDVFAAAYRDLGLVMPPPDRRKFRLDDFRVQ